MLEKPRVKQFKLKKTWVGEIKKKHAKSWNYEEKRL